MGIGPIPWTSMIQYADRYGLAWDVSEAFVDIIREMDQAFIEDQTKESKRLSNVRLASNKKG